MKKKHTHFKISSGDEVFTRLFFIPGWNFIPVVLRGMSSSWDEILSRQKRVNSKRHFTIDRDDFIPGRVSSRDEISRVNTVSKRQGWNFILGWKKEKETCKHLIPGWNFKMSMFLKVFDVCMQICFPKLTCLNRMRVYKCYET